MSSTYKFWFLMASSAVMLIGTANGDPIAAICATLFFCTGMIVDEISK